MGTGTATAPWVMGIAGSHNGAAALYHGARLVAAVQEERLTRQKRAVLLPGRASRAVDALLADQGLAPSDLALVVAAPLTEPDKDEHRLDRHPTLAACRHARVSHHLAHALSAYACAGFEEATALVVDGLGSAVADLEAVERAALLPGARPTDRETASLYTIDRGVAQAVEKHVGAPGYEDGVIGSRLGPFSSLGLAYQQVARFSFGSWDAAGKVMGLAPLGRARFPRELFFSLDGARLAFDDSITGIGAELGQRRAYPADASFHADLAASVQAALEEGLLHLVRRARALTRSRRLVCAGGVFLNSVANERILASGLFDEVFVVPAAEDSGTAIGAAFHGVVSLLGPQVGTRLERDALGPRPTDHAEAIAAALADGARIDVAASAEPAASLARVAELLDAGRAVGFFSGRSELGPRALGQRSILFDPRRAEAKDALNRRKGREGFRPFAPAVLEHAALDWFELGATRASPFMLRVASVRPEQRLRIPAVTHVDGTARVQTVPAGSSPLAEVIAAFERRTGVPIVLNTSFNRAGEPIVESALDAVRTFLAMPLDALWLDGTLLTRL